MTGVAMTVLSLVVVLGVLVFVHELGHFAAAKWAGIRVLRFSIGMGTPIKALSRVRGGTEYVVSWLPIGGYVKMASREEMAGDSLEGGAVDIGTIPDAETFEAAPVWKRFIVLIAGVFLNVVFAWLVFSGVFYHSGRATLPVTTVGQVADSLPAGAEALRDLPLGARIATAGGVTVESWGDIAQGIQNAPGDSVVITLADGSSVVLPIHRDALSERSAAALALEPWRDPSSVTSWRAGLPPPPGWPPGTPFSRSTGFRWPSGMTWSTTWTPSAVVRRRSPSGVRPAGWT